MIIQFLTRGPRQLSKPAAVIATSSFVVGGLLLLWASYIHFHLWHDLGYRHIMTIGPLFLMQSIVGVVVALLVIVIRRVWVAILGAGFAVSTIAGFLLSVEHGLFGFRDGWSAPFAQQAFAVEISAILLLALAALLCLGSVRQRSPGSVDFSP